MAKMNKLAAAKRAKIGRMVRDCMFIDGRYIPLDIQGEHAYRDGVPFNSAWHLHKQQGWKKTLDSDKRFLSQLAKTSPVYEKVLARFTMMGATYYETSAA